MLSASVIIIIMAVQTFIQLEHEMTDSMKKQSATIKIEKIYLKTHI